MAGPIQDDRLKSVTQLAHFASDLQDSEVTQVAQIVAQVSRKYSTSIATVENLEAMRDEVLTRFMDVGVLATVDVAPVLNGQPPTIEIIGRVAGTEQATHGLDHERKQYEVRKATARGEEYLGQKEAPDAAKAQKRFKNQ